MMITMWPAVWLIWLGSSLNARPLLTLPVRPDPRGVIASRDTDRLALAAPARWDSLMLGDTARVMVRNPSGSARPSADNHVRWSVFNTNVATIDSAGLLHAISLGTATVVARTEQGVLSHQVTVAPYHFIKITTGMSGSCGLTPQGNAICWGEWDRPVFDPRSGALPTRANGPPLAAISIGMLYSCGLDFGGALHCAGQNSGGQLGLAYASMFASGVIRAAGVPVFRSISAGVDYACGIASDSTGYCWGSSDSGQVGVTPLRERCKPLLTEAACTTIPLQLAPRYRFLDIAAAYFHTCGVLTDHSVVCWGSNSDGQLGDGTTRSTAVPVRVASDAKFASVTVGGSHTCAVAMDGRGYCWGSNRLGELGAGDDDREHDVPTPIAGGMRFLTLSANGDNGTCGLTVAHTLLCWGMAQYNVVDSSQARDRCTSKDGDAMRCARRPVPESADRLFVLLGRSLGAAICALDVQGLAFCWGFGSGNGSIHHCDELPTPTLVGDGPICAERVRVD